ncbi:MAG: Mrp/NBP35 family ATP-binding protein [Candidatus Njordarchaeia archaeon]
MSKQPPKDKKNPFLEQMERQKRIKERMAKIKYKIAVLSGKGGVGKTTVAVNLAYTLAIRGYKVGLLDADIYGPDVPIALGINKKFPEGSEEGIEPILGPLNIRTMSLQYLLERDYDPVIWMGPLVVKAIQQLLSDVNWGELDYLIIDLPPGTGDEVLGIIKSIEDLTGLVVVVTPQKIAVSDARKAIAMAKIVKVPIIGVIENMRGFICPHCGKITYIFGKGGGEKAAKEFNIEFLGWLPLDVRIMEWTDEGKPFVAEENTELHTRFIEIVSKIEKRVEKISKELSKKVKNTETKNNTLFRAKK